MGLRVLVVDDATFVRDTIKRTLRRMIPDLELLEAIDGRRAVSAIKVNTVDLILSDWEMPEMSGEEFLAWVRSSPNHEDTPFIMVTSRGDRDNVMQAVQAGVSDYLTKPFTAEELERKVHKQLKRMGYSPKGKKALNQQTGVGSIDALTGGNPARVLPQKKAASNPAPKARPGPDKAAKTNKFDGKAWLRFPGRACVCGVREISLQGMSGVLPRPDQLPSLFDQVAVDLEDASGKTLARLNAYIHALAALEPNPECQSVRVNVRFVDDDPQKLDILSRIISR